MTKKWIYAVIAIVLLFDVGCSRSVDDLIEDLSSEHSNVRFNAAGQLMRRSGDREAVTKLVDLLDSDDEQLVFIATQVLGSLSDTLAVRPLGKLVTHKNTAIRSRACWSLGTIGHETAYDYLVDALDDEESDVRYAAVVALGHLHYTPSVKQIFPMIRDVEDSVRVRAIQSLYNYRLDEGAELASVDFAPLLADKSERVRYVVVQALGGAWEDARGWVYRDSTLAGELLVDALNDQNKFVRIEAINSLKRIRFEKALGHLKSMYDRASVDEEVAISEAVKEISGEIFPPSTATGTNPEEGGTE